MKSLLTLILISVPALALAQYSNPDQSFYEHLAECPSCKKIFHLCFGCGVGIAGNDHHCDPKREKKIEDSRKSHDELGIERGRGFVERLKDGFDQSM